MLRFLSSNRTPIGIDVDGRSISAAQLSRGRTGWRVEAATMIQRAEADRPLDPQEVRRLANVLERQGFAGHDAVLALPNDKLLSAILELPPKDSGAPLDQISRVELASAHKCDPNAIEVAFWELPRRVLDKGCMNAMAVGCLQQDAEALLDAIEAGGFNVIGLDVQSCAVSRAVAPMLAEVTSLAAVLNAEWSTSTLVVLLDGTVIYERPLAELGLRRLHRTLQEELGLDVDVIDYLLTEAGLHPHPEEDATQRELLAAVRDRIAAYVHRLAGETRLAVTYVTKEYGREGLDRLLVVGPAAAIPGLAEQLARESGTRASAIAPIHLADCQNAPAASCESPAMTKALGLAQYPKGRGR